MPHRLPRLPLPPAPTGNVDTCDTAGILSTAVNLAASLQVTEALKLLTGQPEPMRRTLLSFDLWTRTTPLRDRHRHATRRLRGLRPAPLPPPRRRTAPHITLCGRNSVQIHEHHAPSTSLPRASASNRSGEVRANGLLLRFHTPPHTLTVFPDGRALIQGTTDTGPRPLPLRPLHRGLASTSRRLRYNPQPFVPIQAF